MTQRDALIHKMDKLKNRHPLDFKDIDMSRVQFYLDVTEGRSIINVIAGDRERFIQIVRLVLMGKYDDDFYRKEAEGVAAMKFGSGLNTRLYCKEIAGTDGTKKIVIMSRVLLNKGVQKNNKEVNRIIGAIQNTEYKLR
jgi:hypothetical protein